MTRDSEALWGGSVQKASVRHRDEEFLVQLLDFGNNRNTLLSKPPNKDGVIDRF
jgi:hypothetical protein